MNNLANVYAMAKDLDRRLDMINACIKFSNEAGILDTNIQGTFTIPAVKSTPLGVSGMRQPLTWKRPLDMASRRTSIRAMPCFAVIRNL